MTTDTQPAKRMPATVLTAAALVGFFGALGGLGSAAIGLMQYADGGWVLMLIGVGVLFGAAVLGYGLVGRYRAAQVAGAAVGLLGMLGAVTSLGAGDLLNVAWSAVAVLAGGLLVLPMSARSWFDGGKKSLSLRATAVASVAALAVIGAGGFVFVNGTLQWSDPAGAKSCAMLRAEINDGRRIDLLRLSGDIGDVGKDAMTPAIRTSVRLLPGSGPDTDALAMLDELHAACVESGVSMPAYPWTYPRT